MNISLTVGNTDNIRREADTIQTELLQDMRSNVVQTAAEIVRRLNSQQSGERRNKIDFSYFVLESAETVEAQVTMRGNQGDAALSFLVTGTKPHIIRGRPGHPLRWFDKQGVVHYAMFVRHPGTKPNPALAAAARNDQGEDLGRVADVINQVTGR